MNVLLDKTEKLNDIKKQIADILPDMQKRIEADAERLLNSGMISDELLVKGDYRIVRYLIYSVGTAWCPDSLYKELKKELDLI